jgi:hypothetical protein
LPLTAPPAAAPAFQTSVSTRPLLGVSLYGPFGRFPDAPAQLKRLKADGFKLVAFIPTYPYVDRDRIDLSTGAAWESLENAVFLALNSGFTVVLKPHLDPPRYFAGYTPPAGAKLGGHADAIWRGLFDLNPMAEDYSKGLILHSLEIIQAAFYRLKGHVPPVRLELGTELANSEVHDAEHWVELLDYAKKERRRRGLEVRLLFSHDFAYLLLPHESAHRLEFPKIFARYMRGLDTISLSQYMDLTVAMPDDERDGRLPTADEIAQALVRHEKKFRRDILEDRLGIRPADQPPLDIGEFGVGSGGLKRPNAWSEPGTAEFEAKLSTEIALGMAGMALYLGRDQGRTVQSAVLWTIGPHYDIFGLGDPRYAQPAAQAEVRAYLKGR